MVKIRSLVRVKDLEIKAGTRFKALLGIEASKVELFDNDRMILNLRKGESIALLDKDDNFYELSRNLRGRHNLRKLKTLNDNGETR
jgi:hypothetical protein